jgi:chemotaxis methyl-accepting protein methylase
LILPPLLIAAARRHLEGAYGLALEGVGDDQIASAIASAAEDEWIEPADPRFLARVVDRLPIDESWLFREDALWEWLRDEGGPALLEGAFAAGRPVRVLSLGCSAGQEPFTAAILFQGLLERAGIPGSAAAAYVQVLGLDSSPARIEAARSGAVPAWSVQRCRDGWLRGRVLPDEAVPGRWLVDPAVRAMCRFEVGNLVDVAERGNAALGGYDLVLCRHVLIYFRPAEAERLAAALGRGLDPGAVLVVSTAEAHLLAPAGLAQLGHLGAGRAGSGFSVAHRRPRPARPARAPRPVPAPPVRSAAPPGRASGAASGAAPGCDDPVAAHVRDALRHAEAGRTSDALREARAALFHDPRHLYSRMLLGQHLIDVDARRGREVLRELLESAQELPADAEVPCADGLSVAQLAAAVKLILRRPEPA